MLPAIGTIVVVAPALRGVFIPVGVGVSVTVSLAVMPLAALVSATLVSLALDLNEVARDDDLGRVAGLGVKASATVTMSSDRIAAAKTDLIIPKSLRVFGKKRAGARAMPAIHQTDLADRGSGGTIRKRRASTRRFLPGCLWAIPKPLRAIPKRSDDDAAAIGPAIGAIVI